MKTIFDKINPQYLECSTGTCGHPEHIGIVIAIASVVIISISLKLKKQ